MVTFLPFAGFRPAMRAGESISDRVSPPYDVIGPEELARLQGLDGNVTNLTLKPDEDKRYRGSRKLLDDMVASGALKQDTPSFYLYDQTFESEGKQYRRRGLVGILRTEECSQTGVIPHEETFSKVKADRLNLLRDVEAHLESIFGIFPGLGEELNKRVDAEARLLYRYTDADGTEHRYSRIADEEVCKAISEKLKGQSMLIADGHHRYETALNYAKENPGVESKQFVLCTMVASDDPGLVIKPTHRLVDAEDIGETTAIKKLGKNVTLTETDIDGLQKDLGKHMLGLMYKSGKCYFADPCKEYDDVMMTLDTYFARTEILNGIYKNDEGKSSVSFDAEFSSVRKAMEDKKHDVAVVLNPPSLKTIWDLAGQGKRMPKKTTFFYPKIWSGWVFYLMRD